VSAASAAVGATASRRHWTLTPLADDCFAPENRVTVGDRGMITTARITALKKVGELGWSTALRAPQIAVSAADTGPLQMSFDEQNSAEITHPRLPRGTARRLPAT
jgi:hypothetical protein